MKNAPRRRLAALLAGSAVLLLSADRDDCRGRGLADRRPDRRPDDGQPDRGGVPDALGVTDRGVSDDRFANRWLADPPDPADPRGLADRRRRHRDG
ncbi:MAG TPA: hypothetical protein PKA95_05130 [Thermomicrobiales bacterium]|nr:hypothetical protein [Thermomicrobiales bacterium]